MPAHLLNMLSNLIVLALLSISSLTSSPAHAAPIEDRSVTLTSLVGDVVCPKGAKLFRVHNGAFVPRTPVSAVWSYIGNFPDPSWQGFAATSTTGPPNMPGSTRSFSLLGLSLTERLNANVGSTNPSAVWQSYAYQWFSLLGSPAVAGTIVHNVQDFLSVSAHDGGAQIEWETIGCANVTVIAESIFDQVHGGAVAATVAKFTTQTSSASTPSSSQTQSSSWSLLKGKLQGAVDAGSAHLSKPGKRWGLF